MRRQLCLCLFLFFPTIHRLHAQPGTTLYRIDSLEKLFANTRETEKRIPLAASLADNFMELDQYDSAQKWLNKVAEILPLKKPTLSNYFLSSRQAEIFYYNGLQRLGLQEAERAQQIAAALNDSVLLADSYNFLGLFYMNLDSNFTSLKYFKEGLRFSHPPPYSSQYFNLSQPYHILGNMAEAYLKTVRYDSALDCARSSYTMAEQAGSQRGMAVATNIAGMVFIRKQMPDSAIVYHKKTIAITSQSDDADVELIALGGLALAHATLNQRAFAFESLEKGFALSHEKAQINNLFFTQFLEDAIAVYKQYGDKDLLINALSMKATLAQQRNKKNDLQMNTLLDEGLKNETRLLNFEVKEAQQQQKLANTRLILALVAAALLAISLLVYRYSQRQKLRVANIRQKISQDLHDDIGASLSSLQIYGTIAEQTFENDPAKAKEMIRKIAIQSRTVMENMGDIVWSMKDETGTVSLSTRIRNYGAELLTEQQIAFTCNIQTQAAEALQSIHARRNIILIIKEAMNNIAKYSKATQATLSIIARENNIVLTIIDNGIGFNMQTANGNGLKNMQQRAQELKGSVIVNSNEASGTSITVIFPLAAVNDTGW